MTSQMQAINTVYEPNDPKHDVHLSYLPWSHMYALALDVVHFLTTGTPLVFLPRFEEKSVLEAIQRYKITWSLVVPPILIILRESKLLNKYDLTTLKGEILSSPADDTSGWLTDPCRNDERCCAIRRRLGKER